MSANVKNVAINYVSGRGSDWILFSTLRLSALLTVLWNLKADGLFNLVPASSQFIGLSRLHQLTLHDIRINSKLVD